MFFRHRARAALGLQAFDLAMDDIVPQVERSAAAGHRVCLRQDIVQRCLGDRPAAEAGDH